MIVISNIRVEIFQTEIYGQEKFPVLVSFQQKFKGHGMMDG